MSSCINRPLKTAVFSDQASSFKPYKQNASSQSLFIGRSSDLQPIVQNENPEVDHLDLDSMQMILRLLSCATQIKDGTQDQFGQVDRPSSKVEFFNTIYNENRTQEQYEFAEKQIPLDMQEFEQLQRKARPLEKKEEKIRQAIQKETEVMKTQFPSDNSQKNLENLTVAYNYLTTNPTYKKCMEDNKKKQQILINFTKKIHSRIRLLYRIENRIGTP